MTKVELMTNDIEGWVAFCLVMLSEPKHLWTIGLIGPEK
jgi:hypothetical protein